jgi:hypothetical protein
MTTADNRATHIPGLAGNRTSMIGSLPHHNVDAALEYSFRLGIPFLPQIPIRNPWEFMIAQALEGLPGLQAEKDGSAILNGDVWQSRAHTFQQKLDAAFEKPDAPDAFEEFEPSPSVSSTWQAFLWELQERGYRLAKIQISGPITAQWALRLQDQGTKPGSYMEQHPELASQIYRLVLAKALAMSRRLQASGIQPLLFLDEPGLYGLSLDNPKHVLGLQELKLMLQTLRNEGVIVGLHCCSNTHWKALLGLDIQVLSIDAGLSLENLLAQEDGALLEKFVRCGGVLSLGVLPTARASFLRSLKPEEIFAHLMDPFQKHWGRKPELARKALHDAIFTPACGLAYHSTEDAELVLEILNDFYRFCTSAIR